MAKEKKHQGGDVPANTAEPVKEAVSLRSYLIMSAKDLQTAFGIHEELKRVAIKFEPKLQEHLNKLYQQFQKPMTLESLDEAARNVALMPDNFLEDIVVHFEVRGTPIPFAMTTAFAYLQLCSDNMMRNVHEMILQARTRVMREGIVTQETKIIS